MPGKARGWHTGNCRGCGSEDVDVITVDDLPDDHLARTACRFCYGSSGGWFLLHGRRSGRDNEADVFALHQAMNILLAELRPAPRGRKERGR